MIPLDRRGAKRELDGVENVFRIALHALRSQMTQFPLLYVRAYREFKNFIEIKMSWGIYHKNAYLYT